MPSQEDPLYDLVVIGGGAAGVFAAIIAKETYPHLKVALLEKTSSLLGKVKISGGGRCNVTHACFDPATLIQNYPRGSRELLGPFYRFQPQNMIAWLHKECVSLKTEADGRMFPESNTSQTIIDCFQKKLHKLAIAVHFKQNVTHITKNTLFEVHRENDTPLFTKCLLLATGSHPSGQKWASHLGHTLQPPVPSLFAFNTPTSPLKELSGVSLNPVKITLGPFSQKGPLLITHFGFSGPPILKLSAWGARFLYEKNYHHPLVIDWLPELSSDITYQKLLALKKAYPHKPLLTENPFAFPKNLWKTLLQLIHPLLAEPLSRIPDKILHELSQRLHQDPYLIEGKTTHKEEFVTCGGVTLKEVCFKTLESKLCKGLFFSGEILDIDGVTGGFNFQNAWTTAFIAGSAAGLFKI